MRLAINSNFKFKNLHSEKVVGIATTYGLDDRGVGVRVPVG
jgi:glutamine synthetase